jgi:hypothetical protein
MTDQTPQRTLQDPWSKACTSGNEDPQPYMMDAVENEMYLSAGRCQARAVAEELPLFGEANHHASDGQPDSMASKARQLLNDQHEAVVHSTTETVGPSSLVLTLRSIQLYIFFAPFLYLGIALLLLAAALEPRAGQRPGRIQPRALIRWRGATSALHACLCGLACGKESFTSM